jgi:hypothetical protein
MEWVKLLAVPSYYIDGALLRAGEAAEVLFCRGLAYCGSVESGGIIDKTVLPMIIPSKPQPRADALVREGLWLDEGAHYRVRSWDKWQDEHDAAAERRRKDRERKRGKRRGLSADVPRTESGRSAESPQLDVEGERDVETQPPTEVGAVADKPRRATRVPDVFPFDDEHAQALWSWALEHAPAIAIRSETENWQDYHRAKGDTARDWTASWRTWMRRAQKDTERRPAPAAVRPSTTDQRVAQGLALVEHFRDRQSKEIGA